MKEKCRIRYFRQENGELVTKDFMANDIPIKGLMNELTRSCSITNLTTGNTMVTFTANSLLECKKEMKTQFKKLGVNFFDEVRNKLKETIDNE